MKNVVACAFTMVAMSFSTASFAADSQYTIIIDAGSSGSRVHLFQADTGKDIPALEDIFSENLKPGLSTFAKNPDDAGASLKKLLDDVTQTLENAHIDPHTVNISVMATAGMRLLPEETQQAIYKSVKTYIKNNYAFPVRNVETITGQMEALYGWLDINYLGENFQTQSTTNGAIDMGGASTQIAFATTDTSKPDDEISLKIGEKSYIVFAKSFLGLGQDQALASINSKDNAYTCYPTNYPMTNGGTGNFNFTTCTPLYSDLIQSFHVAQEVLPTTGQQFIAFSGSYYTYHFFAVDQTPDQASVEKRIQAVCNETWEQLQKDYPSEPAKYLSNYCANAVYLDNLLYSTYQVKGSQLNVTSQINAKDIDWPLGALLYQILSQNK